MAQRRRRPKRERARVECTQIGGVHLFSPLFRLLQTVLGGKEEEEEEEVAVGIKKRRRRHRTTAALHISKLFHCRMLNFLTRVRLPTFCSTLRAFKSASYQEKIEEVFRRSVCVCPTYTFVCSRGVQKSTTCDPSAMEGLRKMSRKVKEKSKVHYAMYKSSAVDREKKGWNEKSSFL